MTDGLNKLGDRLRGSRLGALVIHPIAALVLLLVVLFHPVFLQGYVLSPADQLFELPPWDQSKPPGFQHASNPLRADDTYIAMPRRVAVVGDILRFGVRLWQDHTFAGSPNTLPLGLGSFAYPPALAFFVLPPGWANTLVMISALLLGGICMYPLLGRLTERRDARLFGSAAWMLNGYFIVWLGATSLPLMFAVLPLLMLLASRFLAGRGLFDGALFAVVLGWTFYLSYPPGNLVEGILLALFIGCAWAQAPARLALRVAGLAGFGLLGLAIGALPILTIAEQLGHVLRTGYIPPHGSLFLGNLQTFLFPNSYGNPVAGDWSAVGNYSENIAYAGVATLLLALAGLFTARSRLGREPLLLFSLLAVALSLVAAYELGPVGRLIDRLPLLASVAAARWQVGIDLGLAILATEGFAGLARGRRPSAALAAGALLVAAMAAILVRRFPHSADQFIAGDYLLRAAFLLVAIAALALVWWNRDRLGRGLLIGVLALDLLSFGSGYNPAIPTSEFYPSTPGLAYLRGHASGYRVLAAIHDGRLWPGDVLNMYGVDSVTAYDPYRDDSFLRLLDVSDRERRLWIVTGSVWLGTSINLDNPALDELGVKLAYFPDDVGAAPEYTSDHWEVVYSARDGRIYENRQALPKQFLVPSGGGSAVPVDHRPAFPDADQLTVQGPGLLVWSRPNDPYWDVTVNGRPVTPTSYHDFFQAVPLADGSNSVAVAYHPRTFYLGALLSLAALLAAAAIVAVGLLRRRRLTVSPPPGR